MNDDSKRINRRELYEQVWSVSMVNLAKQYGLSDVGLAKICKKHNIPRPPRGYWARKAAGYNMKLFPLPPGDDVTIEITPNPYSGNISKRKDIVSRMAPSKNSDEETIVVPDRLSSPHPLIQQSSEILNGRQANDVGLINPPKKGCLDITVSKGSLRRALRIMDTVIKSIEKKGYRVYLSEGRTKTKILKVPISFGISEKLVTKKRGLKNITWMGVTGLGTACSSMNVCRPGISASRSMKPEDSICMVANRIGTMGRNRDSRIV